MAEAYLDNNSLFCDTHGDQRPSHSVIVSRHGGHEEGLQGLEGERGNLAHNAKVDEAHPPISQHQQVACNTSAATLQCSCDTRCTMTAVPDHLYHL